MNAKDLQIKNVEMNGKCRGNVDKGKGQPDSVIKKLSNF